MPTPFPPNPVATDFISAAVGAGGANKAKDVARIQAYLNMCPTTAGGPAVKLKQDGLIGPKTQAAINGFQRQWFPPADGRIDPGKRTEKKLIELETGPATRPAIHIEAARSQATLWYKAAAPTVLRHITADGRIVPGAPRLFHELLGLCFNISAHPTPNQQNAHAKALSVVRTKFAAVEPILRQKIRILAIKFLDMTDELRAPKLASRAPLAIAGDAILANYKFTDYDPVCGFGIGPNTRAACFLQAAFIGADFFPNMTPSCDELFIRSGVAPTELSIHESGHYLFFCQAMAAGGDPQPFFHAPSAGTGWQDRPVLP